MGRLTWKKIVARASCYCYRTSATTERTASDDREIRAFFALGVIESSGTAFYTESVARWFALPDDTTDAARIDAVARALYADLTNRPVRAARLGGFVSPA